MDGISENDDLGLGAVHGLSEAGTSLLVVGIDGIQDGQVTVKAGKFNGTSLQNGRVEMATALVIAQKVTKGEPVKKTYTYTMPQVTPRNVDQVDGTSSATTTPSCSSCHSLSSRTWPLAASPTRSLLADPEALRVVGG